MTHGSHVHFVGKAPMSEETAQLVLRQDREGVAVLTVNRPEKFNAMNKDVLQRVEEHLDQLATDDAIDVVVFTGAGDKAFVAGADIQELDRRLPYDGIIGTMQRLYDKIASFSKPTIAAVNGIAFGGGHELALACDIRVGSTNALFALPENRTRHSAGCRWYAATRQNRGHWGRDRHDYVRCAAQG